MAVKARGPKFYGVATRKGGLVATSWDDVTRFMSQHPGAEFHKKFGTESEAWAFVIAKDAELHGGCAEGFYYVPDGSSWKPTDPFLSGAITEAELGSYVSAPVDTPAPSRYISPCTSPDEDDDGEPPW